MLDRRRFIGLTLGGLAAPAFIRPNRAFGKTMVVAATEQGMISGTEENGAISFRGIQYAADTGGKNRFRAPQPVESWSGVRPAFQDGDRCPQGVETFRGQNWSAWYDQGAGFSEDCCVLNVFTPGLEKDARRPVMLYIHGGGFRSGGGGGPGLDGSNLAKFGNAVVISINHRLNLLGYVHLGFLDPEFADSANAGQLDVLAALKWVKANIASFGGDPDNVTVFGQSGGGSKITSLMVMPEAAPYFRRGINMSGVTTFTMMHAESREELTLEFLREVGLGRDDFRRLQDLPHEQLRVAYENAVKTLGVDDYRPVIDGLHIHHAPMTPEGLAVSADKPLIVGTTETEATIWLGRTEGITSMSEDDLRGRVGAQFSFDDAKVSALIEAYRVETPDRTPYEVLAAMASDAVFRGRMMRGVEAKASINSAPVYVYNFTWRLPVDDGVWLTPHTADIPFAFGNVDIADMMTGGHAAASDVARSMMSAFTAFAKKGDPNNPDLPYWKPYDLVDRTTMTIARPCKSVNDFLGSDRIASQDFLHQESFQLLAGPMFQGVK
jgi:Carboxylesterase type B